MMIVTANRLTDGRVVYRTPAGAWSADPVEAERLSEAPAETALNAALRDILTVVGPYLIEVEGAAEGFTPAGRKHVREAIRSSGPSAGSTHLAPGAP